MARRAKTSLEIRVDAFIEDAIKIGLMVPGNSDRQKKLFRDFKKTTEREAVKLSRNERSKTYLIDGKFSGLSCLNNAVKRGHFYLAGLLLEKFRIDPNCSSEGVGKTALHYATEAKSDDTQELFERLVTEYNANVNAMDIYGTSVLHLAVYNDKLHQVKFLLANEATAGNGTSFGCPIHIASFYGRTEMVEAIIQKFPLEAHKVYQGCSPIGCSAYAESPECLMHLSMVFALDRPILYKVIACRRSDEEAFTIVEKLLQLGADANLYDVNLHEEIPIVAAASRGWGRTVQALRERTMRIPGVEWTTEGLLSYAQTEEQKIRTRSRINSIKSDIIIELKNKQLLRGCCLCKSVQHFMEPLEWDKYDSFCKIMLVMGMYNSLFPQVDAESFMTYGTMFFNAGKFDFAQLVAKSCQLLEPSSEQYYKFDDLLEKATSAASSSHRA